MQQGSSSPGKNRDAPGARPRENISAGKQRGQTRESPNEHRRLSGPVERRGTLVELRRVLLGGSEVVDVAVGEAQDQRGVHRKSELVDCFEHTLPQMPSRVRGSLSRERANNPVADPQHGELGKGRSFSGSQAVRKTPEESIEKLALGTVATATTRIGRSLLEAQRKQPQQSPVLDPRRRVRRAAQLGRSDGRQPADSEGLRVLAERQGREGAPKLQPILERPAQAVEQLDRLVSETVTNLLDRQPRGVAAGRCVGTGNWLPLPEGSGKRPVDQCRGGEERQP